MNWIELKGSNSIKELIGITYGLIASYILVGLCQIPF